MGRLKEPSVKFGLAILAIIFGSFSITLPAYASGWTATNLTAGTAMSGRTWTPIAISGGSKYVVAYDAGQGINVSSDHGAHWVNPPGAAALTSLAIQGLTISYTGKYVAAASLNGDIWISSDYGANWTNQTAGTSLSGLDWQTVIASNSGQYMVASAFSDGLYLSRDYGAHWTNISAGTAVNGLFFVGATVSADGRYLTAIDGADVFGSQDSGATWAKLTSDPSLDGQAFYSVAASADGKTIYSAVDNGDIYVSHNYGATWTNLTTGTALSGLDWGYLQTSPSGQFLVSRFGVGIGNGVYASRDYGATWTNLTGSLGSHVWGSPTISASGQYVFVGTDLSDMFGFNDPSLQPLQPVITRQNIATKLTANGSVTVNVLGGANGYDADSLSIVSGPSHGTAVDPPGDITYTPNRGYSGSDSLVYQLCAPLDDTVCTQAVLSFSVIGGPNTGFGQPHQNSFCAALSAMGSLLAIGCGLSIIIKRRKSLIQHQPGS